MRHSILLSGRLHANSGQLSKKDVQVPISAVLQSTGRLKAPAKRALRSYSSASPEPQRRSTCAITTGTTTRPTITQSPAPEYHPLSPSAANPPPTTRPPALTLPTKEDGGNPDLRKRFTHAFETGKAYLTFYKTGLKHILTNRRLLYPSRSPSSSSESESPPPPPRPGTRAHLHLRLRWKHDVRRLPLFALLLLVCGEFTPLVVLAVPRIVPLPCRIPNQIEKLLRQDEEARRRGRAEAAAAAAAADVTTPESDRGSSGIGSSSSSSSSNGNSGEWYLKGQHVRALARVLGVHSAALSQWLLPESWVAAAVRRRLHFLAVDDALLLQAGGEPALVKDEVRLACADRGIAVLGRSEGELRRALSGWLRLTTNAMAEGESKERERVTVRLLLAEEEEWNA
ncbi:hypothetical protein N656DRAFT_780258 [Canariomyces notabilis]|uniref:Letm1 RBD domain-containing protein n=1 Tax=Canariomyces notabilis TaxID=2074819 RepID=A0AAN6TBY8_9PEZI|nr:hypothetical protein N656DRAFT_780258 [Canariomyces arenarius]